MKSADLALLRIPGTPTVSPDGRFAVVDVTRLDLDEDTYRSQLWITPTDGSAPARQLTHGWSDSAPRYSPDGRWLAFLRTVKGGKPTLHVMPTDGGDAQAVTTDKQHPLGAGAPVWSPDSTKIAYTTRVPEDGRYGTKEDVGPDKEPPRRITQMRYRIDNIGFVIDRRSHVFVVDPFADEPTPVQVTDGDFEDGGGVAWSPDGTRLAFTSARHEGREFDVREDVYTCAVDGTDLRTITNTTQSVFAPVFSPDGQTVYYVGYDMGESGREFFAKPGIVWSVPADGSAEPTPMVDPDQPDTSEAESPPVATPDGLLATFQNRGGVDLRLIPYDGAPSTVLLGGQRQAKAFGAAGGVVVATVSDAAGVGELVSLRDGEERVLSDFGAELTATGRVRPMEEITATAPDGYPVHGWVVRPEGEGPHPVLLMIHGGPYAQYGWTLFDEAQVYAGAGYAVVMGNPRGSSGYGWQHGRHIQGDVGNRSSVDVLALLDHALEAPDLDGDRVGVLGGSHGGYMTSWLVGHTDRFKAAISERAVNAIDSFTGASDIGWFFGAELYGPDPAARHAQSPLTYADQINTPLLIIHSEHDWRCPLEQAQRLFVALKLRGVETEMLLFPAGEGHEMSRSGLPSHRIARFEAILDWWSRHL